MKIFFKHTFWLLSLLSLFGCTNSRGEGQKEKIWAKNAPVSVDVDISAEKEETANPPICYRLESFATAAAIDSFQTQYSTREKKIIFALNRIDSERLRVGTKLVIPDSLFNDLMSYSPFPKKLELLDSIPKTVLISQRIQGFALYEEGNLVRWGPVSSGKKSTPTPNGLHYGNYKAKRKVSTVNKAWLLPYYFNFMNFHGVGVHQYAMPGYPASHACVRLYEEDAKFIYDWAEQWKLDKSEQNVLKNGTPFMVYGNYDFEGLAPWLLLFDDNNANLMTKAELDTLKIYAADYKKDMRNFYEEQLMPMQDSSL